MKKVKVKIYSTSKQVPIYTTENSVGADIISTERYVIRPNRQELISTGLFMEIPDGYEVQVRPRSGLAAKRSITITNSPGTIDADYRGEIKVILHNLGGDIFVVNKGDRIAQLVIKEALQMDFEQVDTYEELENTDRGQGGFGHTGK